MEVQISTQFEHAPEAEAVIKIFAGDPDQREQGIAPGIVSAAPIRCGVTVSPTAQTGQSDETHSPEEWASDRGSRYLTLGSV